MVVLLREHDLFSLVMKVKAFTVTYNTERSGSAKAGSRYGRRQDNGPFDLNVQNEFYKTLIIYGDRR